jgi:hypothetical protein
MPNSRPIQLSDEALDHVMRLAHPIPVADRTSYLELVAELLRGEQELGDGVVARAAQEAQRHFLRPPTLEEMRGHSNNSRRVR